MNKCGWLFGLILVFVFHLATSWTLAAPPTVQELVNRFSLTNYQAFLSNRLYTHQGMNRACDYGYEYLLCQISISNEFNHLGFAPVMDRFLFQSPYGPAVLHCCNVLAVKPGLLYPDETYLVSGHYDSVDNPGADDDASGVACVLEMARIFSKCYFARTMVFVAFDFEEMERNPGSLHYVNQHLTNNIKGMVSLDMIAHQSSGSLSNTAWVEGRSLMQAIRNDMKTAIETYGDGLIAYLPEAAGNSSDHAPFMDAGFQACCLAEAEWHDNPNIHKSTDNLEQPDNIDWPYAGKMCKSAIGYFATQLVPLDVTPAALSVTRGDHGSVAVHFSGIPGCKYAIETIPNLANDTWTVMETNTAALSDGTFDVIDSQAGDRESCFYRARFVPPN